MQSTLIESLPQRWSMSQPEVDHRCHLLESAVRRLHAQPPAGSSISEDPWVVPEGSQPACSGIPVRTNTQSSLSCMGHAPLQSFTASRALNCIKGAGG